MLTTLGNRVRSWRYGYGLVRRVISISSLTEACRDRGRELIAKARMPTVGGHVVLAIGSETTQVEWSRECLSQVMLSKYSFIPVSYPRQGLSRASPEC